MVASVDKEGGVLTYYAKEGRKKIADWNKLWVYPFEVPFLRICYTIFGSDIAALLLG